MPDRHHGRAPYGSDAGPPTLECVCGYEASDGRGDVLRCPVHGPGAHFRERDPRPVVHGDEGTSSFATGSTVPIDDTFPSVPEQAARHEAAVTAAAEARIRADERCKAIIAFRGENGMCAWHRGDDPQDGCPQCFPDFSTLIAEHRRVAVGKRTREIVTALRAEAERMVTATRVIAHAADLVEREFAFQDGE